MLYNYKMYHNRFLSLKTYRNICNYNQNAGHGQGGTDRRNLTYDIKKGVIDAHGKCQRH